MPHICFLIPQLNIGGAERQLLTLVCAMNKQHFQITLITFREGGTLAEEFRTAGVTIRSLNKGNALETPMFWNRLARVLREVRPDIVHGYMGICNIYAVLVRLVLPNLRSVYGIRASTRDLRKYSLGALMLFRLECWLSQKSHLIIGNSQSGKNFYVSHGFPIAKYQVIPNGIDTTHYQPHPELRDRIRAEWGVEQHHTLIGIVGRLEPIKDHSTFLKAAAILAKVQPDVRFVCIGGSSDSYLAQLRSLIGELGITNHVVFAGQRKDTHLVYSALDMLTLSSLSEGFPNVVGEAMACGVPCVTTSAGDAAIIVGDVGAVVPVGDPPAMAQAWETLQLRGLTSLGPRARERIVTQFGVTQLVERTEVALLGVL